MSDAPVLSVDANGWVREARHAPSPNFEMRPAGAVPTLVVVHNISLPPGEFGGDAIESLFLNRLDCDAHPYYQSHLRGVRVSAHFLIRRGGELVQFVSCDERAWHAGSSEFFGRTRCNDFSIGIELE
ncbi:1,6-anhydro-N-acetylmuramyl-L-alanine amidase AmpD, partial [Burkholderia sp.]